MKGLQRCMIRLAMVVVLVVSGCAKAGGEPVSSPEVAVQLVLDACQKADYGKAAQYFQGGPRLWEEHPQYVREYLDHYCSHGRAVAFKVDGQLLRGDSRLVQLTTYTDREMKIGLRTMTWQFQRQGAGWIITKVE